MVLRQNFARVAKQDGGFCFRVLACAPAWGISGVTGHPALVAHLVPRRIITTRCDLVPDADSVCMVVRCGCRMFAVFVRHVVEGASADKHGGLAQRARVLSTISLVALHAGSCSWLACCVADAARKFAAVDRWCAMVPERAAPRTIHGVRFQASLSVMFVAFIMRCWRQR